MKHHGTPSPWRNLPAIGLTLALTACALGPDYVAPSQDMGAQFRAAQGWTRTDAHVPALRTDWWTLYDDATLNALMQRLQGENLTILQAEAR